MGPNARCLSVGCSGRLATDCHLDQLAARTVIKLLKDAVTESGATVIAASQLQATV